MTYRGHIKDGVAVLDEDVTLPEGCPVLIEPQEEKARTLADVFRDIIGKAEGLPSDGSIQHDHYIYGTPKIAEPAQIPTLAERLGDLIGSCPNLPEDMAENHDHYLHGQKKK